MSRVYKYIKIHKNIKYEAIHEFIIFKKININRKYNIISFSILFC